MPMHCNDGQPGASVRSDGGETLQKRQQQLSKQLSAPLPSSVPRSRRASEDFSRSQSVATRPSLLTPSAASKKSHAPVRHCKGPAPQPPGGPPKSMAYVRFTPGAAIGTTSASSGSKIARVSESPDRTCHRKVSAERRVSAESGNITTLLADDARIKAIKQREEELFTQRQQETGRYHSTTASDDSIASGSTTKLGYPPAVIRPNGRRPERPKSLPSGVQRRVTFPAAPFAVPGEEPGTGRSELGDGGGIYACIDDEQTRERMPTVDELKAAGIRERLVPRRSDVGAKDLAIWGGAGSIEFPLTLRLRHSDSLGNRTVAEGSEITLCAVRSKELARLVGIDADQQSISYEPVESSAGNTNTLYEVVRGHQAPGSRPNYLWNTTSYSNLQQCLTNSPSKRRIRLTDDFVLNNDIMLKKGEEFIVACDTVSMDTLSVTHIPCWRLSALSEVARAMATAGTVSAHSSGHTHSPSWQTVELVMLPLNDDMGVQECVNSQLLRLSQLAQRYCTQLPMQIIAYEHVPVQPAVFARSGDAAAQLHISTSSQLSLEAMTTETMLLLLIADHPVLVSDRHTFRCDLVPASSPPSASQLCRALAGPAAQSLMTQQYGGKAPPTMTPVMTLERQAFPEEDYMDMRERRSYCVCVCVSPGQRRPSPGRLKASKALSTRGPTQLKDGTAFDAVTFDCALHRHSRRFDKPPSGSHRAP
ncbi:uncharacterized protein LOC135818625 [Sycon ciliatum]|uniref:uncharacterized protein LOC135818625 n=1 Tax=Sycon ciliatum TaxID=27933 RepID=UPI0031F6A50C